MKRILYLLPVITALVLGGCAANQSASEPVTTPDKDINLSQPVTTTDTNLSTGSVDTDLKSIETEINGLNPDEDFPGIDEADLSGE